MKPACTSTIIIQIQDGKIEFFPLFRALALEVEVDETGKQLEELKSMVERVLKRFEEEVRTEIIPRWLIHIIINVVSLGTSKVVAF